MNRREKILLLAMAINTIALSSVGLYTQVKCIISAITLIIVAWNIRYYIRRNN